ncbi:DUF881 domain-containing protein [Thermosediminibacter litoriperuensis]|uniref:Uncharacterized protein YlxW (UPF0749 family) n=1 Tax=Thermosediminibacter litoriperuensis TaxID=291989 RepID=A0A5S5ATU7_9FIRM|nr:DUF881 domain-containing protein [Thermosediminibacter litoriperuensis]TYP54938.1 uncharacterized protein YlxW (UPF0749 family) [Thermosediminibacter litoriperuensis]
MNNKFKGQILIAIVCFVLGLMLVAQFRSTQKSGSAMTSLQRIQELTTQLKTVIDERERLRTEVSDLRKRLNEYENSAANISQVTEAMKKELEKARMVAGLVEGTGPGIIITLDDSNVPKQPGEDPNLFLIHDEDILKVVNELFAAGAEAVSVNGQRIIATTEIRCVGPTIMVNSVRMAPPFVIQAIGNPENLESSMKMRGGIIESLEVFGIQVTIKKHDKIIMPAYEGPVRFQYFEPVKAGE